MKTIKVSEATDIQLDWLVAKCEGKNGVLHDDGITRCIVIAAASGVYKGTWRPTVNWSQIGPILDREGVHLFQPVDSHFKPLSEWWVASLPYNATSTLKRCSHGPTPLIAVARCYVTSKLGGTVEVPEEL